MTEQKVIQLLEQMGRSYRRSFVPMNSVRVEDIRSLLVQELNAGQAPARERLPILTVFRSLFTVHALRPVLAILVVAVFGSGVLLQVASASLPGDALYTVKLVRERAQVRLTLDDASRAKLQAHQAKTRADEVQKVIARPESRELKRERLAVAVAGLEQTIEDVSATLTNMSEKKMLAEEVGRETTTMVQLLSEAKTQADETNGDVAQTVENALALVQETDMLVKITANPPTTFAQSVSQEPTMVKEVEPQPVAERSVPRRRVSDQPAVLLNPAYSVSSLPYAYSVYSTQNLPFATSINSR